MAATPARPANLDALISLVERLAEGFDHLRVDTYYADERIYVGELTVYSQSGLAVFSPVEADSILGSYWSGSFSPIDAVKTMIRGPRRRLLTAALSSAAHAS